MALSANYMPYAPAAPVLTLIRRARDGKLQDAYTTDQLTRLGIAEGNADRVQKALTFLGLIDDDTAVKTPTFDRLSRVTTEEYPSAMAEVIQNGYAPVLAVIDPQEANDIAIHDAFRGYDPAAQRARMVGLFLALCREAGLVEGGPIEGRRAHVRPRARSKAAGTPRPQPTPTGRTSVEEHAPMPEANGNRQEAGGQDYRMLGELIRQLPRDGRWTTGKRDRWIQAVTATVDLLVTQVADHEVGPS
ncbi:MAG TPA: DUF5343 domain-containing protein [Candidatus Dormibacteraeota bacterium]|nr:DUF5343 domain-containing protein [Candidatus Dormibacteraeota bacterium]